MNKVILVIKIVAALWASVIALIKQAEEMLPEQGQGAQKLAIVRAALEAAFQTFKDLEVRFEEVWPTLAAMIASVVAVFNSRGVFKKGPDAPE
ncbi:MAG: hypothetical protein QG638_2890 [Pseudomonadota bacterium]|jgi:hypothetical protein|nr:hypothetical protein [Pseudomonadota bacterium]MDQ5904023.1 hypothetical protein [Pseudomonadota bacterium]MDQ5907428.1 hypothetical protein [Pseudomonadota bacterium]MDQ5918865.1 hypothetical protein [Pseudomonadota bacterium]MDQ5946191.1 hypothetical protein [Pseudomonadota bacterium]